MHGNPPSPEKMGTLLLGSQDTACGTVAPNSPVPFAMSGGMPEFACKKSGGWP